MDPRGGIFRGESLVTDTDKTEDEKRTGGERTGACQNKTLLGGIELGQEEVRGAETDGGSDRTSGG